MLKTARSPKTTLALLASLAIAAAIGVLTLLPGISDGGVPGSDKFHHALAFFALALPLSFAQPRLAPWIVAAAIAYGGTIELIQPYAGRDRDAMDFLADAAGAVVGAVIGAGLHRLRHRAA